MLSIALSVAVIGVVASAFAIYVHEATRFTFQRKR
jgi:hypothetical protein